MNTTIQKTEAYELSVEITHTRYGVHLQLLSLVPIARNPLVHSKFQGTFSEDELRALRDAIDHVLVTP